MVKEPALVGTIMTMIPGKVSVVSVPSYATINIKALVAVVSDVAAPDASVSDVPFGGRTVFSCDFQINHIGKYIIILHPRAMKMRRFLSNRLAHSLVGYCNVCASI